VSIGIDIAPLSEARFETMYRRADQALYKAKGAGRNRYVIAELDVPSLPA
jgi:PleD family two-component response regulator